MQFHAPPHLVLCRDLPGPCAADFRPGAVEERPVRSSKSVALRHVGARCSGWLAGVADGGQRHLDRTTSRCAGVARENEELRQRVLELEGELQAEQAPSRARVGALEEAAQPAAEPRRRPTLAARVIAGNPSPGALTVTIDRGSDDGVEPNMAVIARPGRRRPRHRPVVGARGARAAAHRSVRGGRR